MDRTRAAAAILAGGRARRFGGEQKSILRVGGLRIIDRQVAVLRDVADPVFVVAPDPDPFADLGLEVTPDLIPGCGALGGIYTAIVRSPRERTIVVACDMPFLSGALIGYMAERRDGDLVIPRSRRGYEPLCAVYGSICAAPIRQRIDAGMLQASQLPEGVRVVEIGPEIIERYDPGDLMFVNVNTPHDFAHAQDLSASMAEPQRDRITDKHSAS
jgi:molybdopterin-guanine dinucleotide biosynthesis protein A